MQRGKENWRGRGTGEVGTEEGEAMWETRETKGSRDEERETRGLGKVTVSHRRGGKRDREEEEADKVRSG